MIDLTARIPSMKHIFILPLCLILLCSLTVVSLAAVCDLNADSAVNALDLQFMINAILGASTASMYDLNQDGQVNALDLQSLANVVLGTGTCPGSGGVAISAVSATNITTSGATITTLASDCKSRAFTCPS